ncbi:hypothetical protein C8J57DRAFT_1505552 [Mycena rebaudengoi]|nr:hypothetical protein C8J57DRAFT_1505552 [Mycena rebaudengoi]
MAKPLFMYCVSAQPRIRTQHALALLRWLLRAGARAAHMRILYPDLVYGGIAPRAAHATIVNREYMEMIRRAAPPRCSAQLENAIRTIDSILSAGRLSRPLKMFLGLGELRHDDDFTRMPSNV